MPEANPKPAFKRYYGEDCKLNPELNSRIFNRPLHAAFTQWLAQNGHIRDFDVAVHHCATLVYVNYELAGRPEWDPKTDERIDLESEVFPLALPRRVAEGDSTPPVRFYDDQGNISSGISTDMLDSVCTRLFVWWVSEGWHPRDFILAVREAAGSIEYDYNISCSLGGLGGCLTAQAFLTNPYPW